MSDQTPEFTDVYLSASSIWARKWWIIAGIVIGGLLAAGFVFTQPDTSRSWAQVLIRPLGLDLTRGSANANNAIDPVTERELASSLIVAERAASKVDTSLTPRDLRKEVEVTGVDRSPVLEFSYAESDPELARDVAQAFADSYLEIRAEIAAASLDDARQSLSSQRDSLNESLTDVNQQLTEIVDDEAKLRAALSEQSVLTGQVTELSNDIALLDSLTSDPGVVISPAQLAQSSERPRAIPISMSGAILGGLLGLLAALFADRNDRQRDVGERELGAAGLPPVAYIPRLSGGADAYVGLERRLVDTVTNGGAQVLAVTTLTPGGHQAQVAASLALHLAQTGRRVLLISADFEQRSISKQLGLAQGPGLLDVLVSGETPDAVVQESGLLKVLTAGDGKAEPASILRMVGMRRLLEQAREHYELIIMSAPDLLARESSLLTTWAADAVVCVVDTDDRRSEIERAAELLRRTDTSVLGSVVLTDTSV